jgi:hypothetical protein
VSSRKPLSIGLILTNSCLTLDTSPIGERDKDKDHWLVALLLFLSFIILNDDWFILVVVVVRNFPQDCYVHTSIPSTRTGTTQKIECKVLVYVML